MPSLASYWILALFQSVISDVCHALIVIFATIRSYGCNDRLEWAASSRHRDQPAQAVATATLPPATMLKNDLVVARDRSPPSHCDGIGWRGHGCDFDRPAGVLAVQVGEADPVQQAVEQLPVAGGALQDHGPEDVARAKGDPGGEGASTLARPLVGA